MTTPGSGAKGAPPKVTAQNEQQAVPAPQLALERTCACGSHTPLGGECETCGETRRSEATDFWPKAPKKNRGLQLPLAARPRPMTSKLPAAVHTDSTRRRPVIIDADAQRAELTHRLVEELISRLSLRADEISIHVDGEARRLTQEHGAAGLAVDEHIYLHPERYHPELPSGKTLLGHEAAHIAQAQRFASYKPLDALLAEQEAERIAAAFAVGLPLPAIREALPTTYSAANIGMRAAAAVQAVRASRRHELQRIRELLSTNLIDWAITDGDVFAILNILAGVPFVVAAAMVRSLEPSRRRDLVGNINPVHFRQYRPQVLAAYIGLEPSDVFRFDQNLLREMNLANLDPEEREAVRYVLEHLSSESRSRLLNRENLNRSTLAALITAPELTTEESEAATLRAARAIAEEETAARERGGRSQQFANDPDIRQTLTYLRQHRGDPIAAWNRLAAVVDDPPLFRYLVETLEEEGLLDRLVEGLPAGERAQPPDRARAFLEAIRLRPVFKNVEMIERLLSTGWFNGVSRDEARFAYLLVRRLPLADQERFRRRDDGRLLRNLEEGFGAEGVQSDEYRGLEFQRRNGELIDITEEYRSRIAADGDRNVEAIEALARQGMNTPRATQIFERLVAIHRSQPASGPGGGPTLLEAVVHRLDIQGIIDSMFAEMSSEQLFTETYRPATLRIMLARDSVHILLHARQLLRQNLLNAVTAREAYLAYQLIRALPDDERAAFIRTEPDLWNRISAEMSDEMLRSSDINAHVERLAGGPQARVRAQLLNRETWRAENAAQLRSLVSMACTLGDRRLVFDLSQRFRAYEVAELADMVRAFSLFDPADPARREYNPVNFRVPLEGGFFDTLGRWGSFTAALFHTLGTLALSSNVNLSDAPAMAGPFTESVRPVRFAEQTTYQIPQPSGTTREVRSNRIHLSFNSAQSWLRAELPVLEIESINYPLENANLQTGRVWATGVVVYARFASQDLTEANHLDVKMASVDLADLVYAGRDSLTAAAHLGLGTLRLAGSARDINDPAAGGTRPPGWYAFIPFLSPLIRPLVSLLNAVRSSSYRPDLMHDFSFSFSRLNIEGLNVNGEQQVGGIEVRDFSLRAGTRPAFLRGRIASLVRRRAAEEARARQENRPAQLEAIDAQISADQDELRGLEPAEGRYNELDARAHLEPQSLSPSELEDLNNLRQQMRGGTVVDVGRVRLTGVEGRLTADDLDLEDLHGSGENLDLAMLVGPGLLSNPELLHRLGHRTALQTTTEEAADTSTAKIELGTVKSSRLEWRGAFPTSAELQRQLDLLGPASSNPLRAYEISQLRERLGWVVEFERLAAQDPFNLNPPQRNRMTYLEQILSQDVVVRTGPLLLQQARLDLNLATGEQSLFAGRLRLERVEMPGSNLRIALIEGREVSAGGIGAPGLAGLGDLLSGSGRFTLRASDLTASGVSMRLNEEALYAELESLQQIPDEAKNDSQRIRQQSLLRLREQLSGIRQQSIDAERRAADPAATPAARLAAQTEIAECRAALETWLNTYSVDSISFQGVNGVGGMAGFLAAGQSQSGGSLTGAGPDGRLFDRMTMRGFSRRDPFNPVRQLSMREIGLGPTSGTISLAKNGFRFDNVHIESVQLTELFMNSPTMQIGGQNTLVLSGIDLTGSILFAAPEAGAPSGTPESQQRMVLDIERLLIQRIDARSLDYFDVESDINYHIESGALRGIAAESFRMEMPEAGENIYRQGRASVQAAEDINFQVAWVNGMRRARGRLDAQTLSAQVLDDGALQLDLQALQLSRVRLTDEDLDLAINMHARGIRATLRHGGRRTIGVQSASGRVQGHAHGAELDAEFNELAGSIEMSPDRWVVPALNLRLLTMQAFNFTSPATIVRIPEGGSAVAENLTAALTIEWNVPPPPPEPQPGQIPQRRAPTTMRRIVVTHADLPTLRVRGLYYESISSGFTLTLPVTENGVVEGLTLNPTTEGGEGFVIEPPGSGHGWLTTGNVGARSLDLRGLRAAVAGKFNATTDIHATNLNAALVRDRRNIPIQIGTLDLTNIEAQAGTSRFQFLRRVAGPTGTPGVSASGVRLNLDPSQSGAQMVESASAEGVEVTGLRVEYPDTYTTVEIRRASLPSGFDYQRSGRVSLPRLNIHDAHFEISNLEPLINSSGPRTGTPTQLADLNFLDHLSGHVATNVYLPIELNVAAGPFGGGIEIHRIQNLFPIDLDIISGRISFRQLESTALGAALNEVLDFEVRGDRIVLEFDPRRLMSIISSIPYVGPLPAIGGGLARTDLVTWTVAGSATHEPGGTGPVSPREAGDASRGMISLRRLINPDPSAASSGTFTPVFRWQQLELRAVNAALDLMGETSFNLGSMGIIHMGMPGGHDSITRLTLRGSTATGITLGMQEAIARLENLTLKGATINTGFITVQNMRNVNFTFGARYGGVHYRAMPSSVAGDISSAAAENIVVEWTGTGGSR